MYKYRDMVGVGGHSVKISLVDGSNPANESDAVADFYRESNEIRVGTKSPNGHPRSLDFLNQCLCHELTESVKEYYGVKIEQDDIDRMAQGWWQILKQYGVSFIEEVK